MWLVMTGITLTFCIFLLSIPIRNTWCKQTKTLYRNNVKKKKNAGSLGRTCERCGQERKKTGIQGWEIMVSTFKLLFSSFSAASQWFDEKGKAEGFFLNHPFHGSIPPDWHTFFSLFQSCFSLAQQCQGLDTSFRTHLSSHSLLSSGSVDFSNSVLL